MIGLGCRRSRLQWVRYRSSEYQATSWSRPRQVIAKVEHHLGELFPRVGFIVTTLTGTNRAVVRFYNRRGTAEQWIKEGKTATHWTRLSCHRFRANEVRLLLGVIAYNRGNLLRRLVLPFAISSWSLTSLQQRLFKTGGRLIRHARQLHPPTGREPLDADALSADSRAHRAIRGASRLLKAESGGSTAGGGSVPGEGSHGRQTLGRRRGRRRWRRENAVCHLCAWAA